MNARVHLRTTLRSSEPIADGMHRARGAGVYGFRLALFGFLVGCAPLPAASAATTTPVVITADDATFVADEIKAGHAVLYENDRALHGCDIAATYVSDGTTQRLAALASNDLPTSGACAHATQLVTASSSLDGGLTFEPIDAPQISVRATRTHLTASIGGNWALSGLCTLPCDAWVMPGARAQLHDATSDRTISVPDANGASHDVVVTMEKEKKEPALGWTLFGVGVAATPFAVYGTYAMFTSPGGGTPSSNSGSSGAASDQLAGMLLMPLLTLGVVAMAGWGLWYLVHTPGYAPVARREVSRAGVRCGLGGCSF